MNLNSLLCFCSVFIAVLSLVVPEAGEKRNDQFPVVVESEDDFEGMTLFEVFGEVLSSEQLDAIEDLEELLENTFSEQEGLSKRDLESTLETVLNYVNKSEVIWEALDYAADSPLVILYIANLTARLISSLELSKLNTSKIKSYLGDLGKDFNTTKLTTVVAKSGIVKSTLDGILLDEDTRKHISDIIYNLIEKNINLIALVGRNLLKSKNSKRADEDSLSDLIGNYAGAFLGSDTFYDGLGSTLNALNDTGFIVELVQRFLATPAYLNMTGDLISQIADKSDFELSSLTSSINITKIVLSVLSDTGDITKILGKIIKGDYSDIISTLGSGVKRYIPAVKGIITDLEDKGLFTDLNNALFPSSSSSNKKAEATGVASASIQTVSESGSNGFVMNGLLFAHAFFAIVFFL